MGLALGSTLFLLRVRPFSMIDPKLNRYRFIMEHFSVISLILRTM